MKNQTDANKSESNPPQIRMRAGRLWFTKEMERRFFFILTLIMLAVGILYKLEWVK